MAKHNPDGEAEKAILRKVFADRLAARRLSKEADDRATKIARDAHGKKKGNK